MSSLQIFVDSANLDDIKKYQTWGIVDGVTTNQKIFLMEKGCSFEERVHAICAAVDGPVSVETTGHGYEALVQEGRTYHAIAPNVVVKVAMYKDGTGLQVVNTLASEGIQTNVTTLMSARQALLAAKAGATYVSLFFRRIIDAGEDAEQEIRICAELLERHGMSARIIAGSLREPHDVIRAAAAGAHIVTIPPKILEQLPYHAKTEETIAEFDRAWEAFRAAEVTV